jgi:hypothetical protein
MINEKPKSAIRGGSLAASCGAVLMLLVVATIVQPLSTALPAGTDVTPVDSAGVNLLEPAVAATGTGPQAQVASGESVERVVGEWTPTGGGAGGGGSPKK